MEIHFPSLLLRTLLFRSHSNVIFSYRSGATLPGASSEIFSQADNFVANGNIQRIDFVMTPPSLPAASADVVPVNVPAGSGIYDPKAIAKPVGSATSPSAKSTANAAAMGTSISSEWTSLMALAGVLFFD